MRPEITMSIKNLSKSHRLLIVIAISSAFFLAEIAVGFYTRALVLVADAFHYLTDLIGYIVAFVALKVSERRDAPKVLPFGWQRATLLGAFFNGVFLLGLGVSIFLQSIERFVSIERVQNPKLVLIIGCVGLALNLLSASFLHEHSHDEETATSLIDLRGRLTDISQHEAHRHERLTDQQHTSRGQGHDLGMLGILLHVMGDAANNVGVIIAAALMWQTQGPARFYADPAVSVGIALMIILSSLPLMKRSGSILMQSMPGGVDPDDVTNDLEAIPGVLAVHDLHIWLLNQQKAVASAHVMVSDEIVNSIDDFMQLANIINECFHAYGIHSATLQPETVPAAALRDPASAGEDISVADQVLRKRGAKHPICRIGCRTSVCRGSTCCD